jgi:NAD(P)-dependent dehydrogenase (short-subunit alcohol dehydrogenase family)/rhamnose utilization protein RhaD (predicted bifunctional aldolase and dehydrogenase)
MNEASLSQLIEVSRAVGTRPEFVQGGGGNTSVKSPGGATMAVKASGTSLAAMSEDAGWCEMDVARLLELFDRPYLADLAADERERRVLDIQRACVIGGPGERPSVEAALHALLGRVVIHTHPVAVNALTCGPGGDALRELARDNEPPPLWVGYTDPGYTLAVAVKAAIDAYATGHGRPPQALFLQNHGLFVSADDAESCRTLHDDWYARCEAWFAETAPPLQSPPEADAADVRKAMAWIRRVAVEHGAGPLFARLSSDPELLHASVDDRVATVLVQGALTPDQIVYTGAHSAYAASLLDIERALGPALEDLAAPPRLLIVQGVGTFVLSDRAGKLGVIETVASSAAKTIRLANGRGGAHNLAPNAADFIIGWEVEHYRAKQLAGAAKPLSGKVAVVTGAASGLGLGIAHGLAEAGAAVAHADIDDAGLAAAVDASCDPPRALAVHMDVTDELAVARAFDEVIRHWGGVDVVVCAAGIAPSYPLVEMPVEKWRLALEINLTGYFLVAREAARVMQAQGGGGAMVMVSSKSGLEASKANSAYNATKAGELHLMRGWALELGEDGIRVNAVAPGNVFEGSKIWNPDYIKVCAAKKGIEPEEVIPYYVNMTSLKREIKRNDIASAVVFLCSDAARCVTGQTLVVDSGQVMVR